MQSIFVRLLKNAGRSRLPTKFTRLDRPAPVRSPAGVQLLSPDLVLPCLVLRFIVPYPPDCCKVPGNDAQQNMMMRNQSSALRKDQQLSLCGLHLATITCAKPSEKRGGWVSLHPQGKGQRQKGKRDVSAWTERQRKGRNRQASKQMDLRSRVTKRKTQAISKLSPEEGRLAQLQTVVHPGC